MPKKMTKEVDRRFKASVERQYAEQSTAIRFQRAAYMSGWCNRFASYQTPENPFVDRVRDSFEEYMSIQGDLSRQEQSCAAIRLKIDNGIKLGRRERFRLWRSEKKEAKLTAKMEQKYREMREYSEAMAERCADGSDLKQFFEAVTYAIDLAQDSPEMEMDGDVIMNIATAESGYIPEPTAAEAQAAAAAEAAANAQAQQQAQQAQQQPQQAQQQPQQAQHQPPSQEQFEQAQQQMFQNMKVGISPEFQDLLDQLEAEGAEFKQGGGDQPVSNAEAEVESEDKGEVEVEAEANAQEGQSQQHQPPSQEQFEQAQQQMFQNMKVGISPEFQDLLDQLEAEGAEFKQGGGDQPVSDAEVESKTEVEAEAEADGEKPQEQPTPAQQENADGNKPGRRQMDPTELGMDSTPTWTKGEKRHDSAPQKRVEIGAHRKHEEAERT